MPGDGEDAIGLNQKPDGTGKPDRSASAPRHPVGVVGWDSTPCMSGLGKNNASGADRSASVWIVGDSDRTISEHAASIVSAIAAAGVASGKGPLPFCAFAAHRYSFAAASSVAMSNFTIIIIAAIA